MAATAFHYYKVLYHVFTHSAYAPDEWTEDYNKAEETCKLYADTHGYARLYEERYPTRGHYEDAQCEEDCLVAVGECPS
ncbi:hypothetical protein GCM10023084_53900 [Streptomyces lacrimifluminis]|uniref:Uncharacterized protein n=1 Tax=Streptomyces lacrimifluminis TaxID=1500077 RepID=A0A917NW37_9ACTN|nr:hypothetical protein [Streptomyces lacrimifluminis]GGJ34403.1 hypothetical protein GCM10012282_33960 [Streptomyces lacrimifluminis]